MVVSLLYEMQRHVIALLYRYAIAIVARAIFVRPMYTH